MGYSDLVQLYKDAKDLATGAHNLQLHDKLLQLQVAMYEMLDENRELRTENHELKNEKIISSEIERKDNAYYHNGKGPYCTTCYDSSKKLVYYTTSDRKDNMISKYMIGSCAACGNSNVTLGDNPKYQEQLKANNRGISNFPKTYYNNR